MRPKTTQRSWRDLLNCGKRQLSHKAIVEKTGRTSQQDVKSAWVPQTPLAAIFENEAADVSINNLNSQMGNHAGEFRTRVHMYFSIHKGL
jgi:hypothetical protein